MMLPLLGRTVCVSNGAVAIDTGNAVTVAVPDTAV